MLEQLVNATPLLQQVETWLRTDVTPSRSQLDADANTLFQAFNQLAERGWLALRLPLEVGGGGGDEVTYFAFQALLARYSGSLAFLQTQHQSAGGFIYGGRNPALQQAYLPQLGWGQRRLGIGFSHLRRPVITLKAVSDGEGFRLSGTVPWVTGWGLFDEFVGAAILPSGEAVFGLIPLVNPRQEASDLRISQPHSLAAMAATQTVEVKLQNWQLPADKVIDIKPANWIQQNDRKQVLKAASFALGCAQAGLDTIDRELRHKGWHQLIEVHAQLQEAVNQCFTACIDGLQDTAETDEAVAQRRVLRARAVALAGKCAQGAIAVAGGAANSPTHPAQCIYQEALVFTVTGQTPEMAEAILKQLASS